MLAVARKLDYAPSAAARTLVKSRSEMIGVVLFTGYEHPDIHHPFFQEVLVGLKHGIGELGYDLLLFATEQSGRTGADRTRISSGPGNIGSTASSSWA